MPLNIFQTEESVKIKFGIIIEIKLNTDNNLLTSVLSWRFYLI